VIVVGGEDDEVLSGLAPALILRLMAQDENVGVDHRGHFVEQLLAVLSAPSQNIRRARPDDVVYFQLPVKDAGIEFIHQTVGRQRVRHPYPVFASDR